jgi:glycolate oxidase FAD binding subunit
VARVTPGSIEEVQALLGEGAGTVLFVGGETAMPPGPAVDVEVGTSALNRIVEYAPADQVVTAECGITLGALQQELGKNGQRLALDPPHPEKATIGGVVAASSFGPLRTRYGSVRDLIIGVSVVRADGTRAKGGGKVVKTVAGFDLPKLMCGSYGTLAFIATATFRVHPVPEAAVTLRARGADPVELVRRIRALQLEPAAMIALGEGSGWDVFVRFEGFGAGVRAQRSKLAELEEVEWPAPAEGGVRIRFGALPTHAAQVAKALAPLRARIEWLPMVGLGFAHCGATRPGASSVVNTGTGIDRGVLEAARRDLTPLGGWLTAPGDWGPPPPSIALQRAVKKQFDPQGRLAPGRFIV